MSIPMRKTHPLIKLTNNSLIDLPSPSNMSLMWNMGSMMGICLMIQISTGLFLSIHYTADIMMAFNSLSHICRDVNMGWTMRTIHANSASIFFICIYFHVARGIYYKSFMLKMTWMSGIILLLLTMVTAFLGYVLPWGQMSFWGGTVITNLLSAIPYLGKPLVQWVWGGFAVNNPTLTRFFSFHFLLPFILMAFIMVHFMFLHETGSSNPLGTTSNMNKIPFHPYFSTKDLMGIIIILLPLYMIMMHTPYLLSDPENFLPANPLITPIHIQPEWYFLFAYAILRSIPNKLGGVIALIMSILMLMTFIFMAPMKQSSNFNMLNKKMFWMFSAIFILLTWIGARPVEMPYIMIGQLLTILYFLYFPMLILINK